MVKSSSVWQGQWKRMGRVGIYPSNNFSKQRFGQLHYGPSMMSQGKTLRKTPEVGLEGFEGSFQVKDDLERPLSQTPVNPLGGLSLRHH